MISTQYINIELDEERFFTHKYRSNTELLGLWASFKQVYTDFMFNRQLNWVPGFMDMVYIHNDSL